MKFDTEVATAVPDSRPRPFRAQSWLCAGSQSVSSGLKRERVARQL